MVDADAVGLPTAGLAVQRVALREEVLERVGSRRPRRPIVGGPAHVEGGAGRASRLALHAVVARRPARGALHLRPVVRQAVERPPAPDGERVRRVEAEEPDAGYPSCVHVRAQVGLEEIGERERPEPDRVHGEGNDADVGAPLERVDRESRRHQPPEDVDRNLVVQKQEIAPSLLPRLPGATGLTAGRFDAIDGHGRPQSGPEPRPRQRVAAWPACDGAKLAGGCLPARGTGEAATGMSKSLVPPPSSASTPAPPPRQGEQVANRYVVEEELASGGMGVVYRVRDRSTGEQRALKRLRSEAAAQKYLVEAFEREYQVLAGLDHPRIIRVFDYGVDTVGPYYAMELVVGEDMRTTAPMPVAAACRCLRDVATSLALLHARRLLHRDLSPRNVRMTVDGRCKLIDFGALASFGASNLVVGTAPAIPPEALDGAPLDQRSDLYSLGALAYWVLTGRHAYPARRFEELEALWKTVPPLPSTLAPDIPAELDELVMSLLSADPRGRPASAAEVILRMNVVAGLPAEDADDVDRLAESFLLNPRFVGRASTLDLVRERVGALASRGRGAALRIEAVAGMGRSRMLEEIGVRAQVAGAAVVRVDASANRDWNGTARALVLRLLDAQPRLSRERAEAYRPALTVLGRDVDARLSTGGSGRPSALTPPAPEVAPASKAAPSAAGRLHAWFVEISRGKPLVVQVDNVDDADDASLGLLVALARASADNPLLLIVTERVRRDPRVSSGLATLQGQCIRVALEGLTEPETLELCRSIFGDAQNIERYAGWLQGRTAGSPLHCTEISRRLLAEHIIRYIDGMWSLPAERPNAELPSGLEEALSLRLVLMSDEARGLAECLCLQREQPTLALCRQLFQSGDDETRVLHVLDELARSDVLYADQGGYRFSSSAIRDAVLAGMDSMRQEENHRRLGEALASLASEGEERIEAGWHLIKGADGLRGADMIAAVTTNSANVRHMIANLHHVGQPIEAALQVYKRHRRSIYERLPLVAALAQAGYYEHWSWAERYGDEALDACEDLSGVRTARALRRFLGRWLAMVVGLFVAFLRFRLTPRRERRYRFDEMLVQLFGAVTTLTGAAALCHDVERATRVTQVLEIFSVLPERLAPVGIYQFCTGLREIGRERQAQAYKSFETLLRRFADPKYYPELPADARILYVTGAHVARGAFATFRADGRDALDSADALEASGLKMYAMIASQLRFLYYMNRGEVAKAAPHREQVELHAAHVGSAWQVETWEPAALLPVASRLRDVIGLTRIADRLEQMSESIPSMRTYQRLSYFALMRARGAFSTVEHLTLSLLASAEPRSFIGWAQAIGVSARACNEVGDHAKAKTLCADALVHITDEDREYVGLFLDLDIEMAIAEAWLGDVDAGLARLDRLIERFRTCDHPLVLGCLHEARARIAWRAGLVAEYVHSLTVADKWFRATGTPSLIAKCDRLAALRETRDGHTSPAGVDESQTQDAVTRLARGSEDVAPADLPTMAAAPKRSAGA